MVFDKKLRKSIAGLKKMPTIAPAIERESNKEKKFEILVR